jgi:hypothetical protein
MVTRYKLQVYKLQVARLQLETGPVTCNLQPFYASLLTTVCQEGE